MKFVERIELSKHTKQGDTFYTPFTDPSGLGAILSLSSWAKCWLPEFMWIGLIIKAQGRKNGFENLYHIIEDLKTAEIVIPQLSKVFALSDDKQELFWTIVMRYVEKTTLTPLTAIVTPDISTVFYN